MIAECIDCGAEFHREPDEPWKTRCLPCWRENREPDVSRLKAEIAFLRSEIDRLRERQAQFTADELKRIRRLCHPDRHGGSLAANEISQRVNAELARLEIYR